MGERREKEDLGRNEIGRLVVSGGVVIALLAVVKEQGRGVICA